MTEIFKGLSYFSKDMTNFLDKKINPWTGQGIRKLGSKTHVYFCNSVYIFIIGR